MSNPPTTVGLQFMENSLGAMVTSEMERYFIEPFAKGNTREHLALSQENLPVPETLRQLATHSTSTCWPVKLVTNWELPPPSTAIAPGAMARPLWSQEAEAQL